MSFVKSKTTKKTGSAQSSHQGDARKKRYEKEKAIPSAKNAAENKAGRKLNRFPFLFLSEALKNFFIGVFPKPPVRTAALFPLPVMKRTFFRGNFGILDSTEKGADRTLSALKTTRAEKGERRNVGKRVLAQPRSTGLSELYGDRSKMKTYLFPTAFSAKPAKFSLYFSFAPLSLFWRAFSAPFPLRQRDAVGNGTHEQSLFFA